MTVAELIEWLKTQPQEAIVLVLETSRWERSYDSQTEVSREEFDPAEHVWLDRHAGGSPKLLLGNDDEQ